MSASLIYRPPIFSALLEALFQAAGTTATELQSASRKADTVLKRKMIVCFLFEWLHMSFGEMQPFLFRHRTTLYDNYENLKDLMDVYASLRKQYQAFEAAAVRHLLESCYGKDWTQEQAHALAEHLNGLLVTDGKSIRERLKAITHDKYEMEHIQIE